MNKNLRDLTVSATGKGLGDKSRVPGKCKGPEVGVLMFKNRVAEGSEQKEKSGR